MIRILPSISKGFALVILRAVRTSFNALGVSFVIFVKFEFDVRFLFKYHLLDSQNFATGVWSGFSVASSAFSRTFL